MSGKGIYSVSRAIEPLEKGYEFSATSFVLDAGAVCSECKKGLRNAACGVTSSV